MYIPFAGSTVLVPQQCTGFNGVHGPEDQERAMKPFQPAEEVLCDVYGSEHNKPMRPPLGTPPGEGTYTYHRMLMVS